MRSLSYQSTIHLAIDYPEEDKTKNQNTVPVYSKVMDMVLANQNYNIATPKPRKRKLASKVSNADSEKSVTNQSSVDEVPKSVVVDLSLSSSKQIEDSGIRLAQSEVISETNEKNSLPKTE